MKELIKKIIIPLLVITICTFNAFADNSLSTSLAFNDPLPIYNTADPHSFMFTQRKEKLVGCKCCCGYDKFSFSLAPYYQKATQARTFDKERVPLGDMRGRWSMLGLLYGNRPQAQCMPIPEPQVDRFCNTEQLCCAEKAIFPNISVTSNTTTFPNACTTMPLTSCSQTIPDQDILFDPLERIGYFSVPLKYRKVGMRFELSIRPIDSIGFTIQTGFADVKQTLTEFVDLTASQTSPMCDYVKTCDACGFTEQKIIDIEKQLMCLPKACTIFKEIGLDICDFHETGIEDVYIGVWWRHPFCVNRCADDWPEYSFTPFIMGEGSVPTGKKADRLKAFALPLGNDGHASIGFRVGFDIDFKETIAIDIEAGFTHFYERTIQNLRIPTHEKQSGVYPWTATAKVQPGNNGHCGLGFHAYRFLDRLSCSFQYLYLTHQRDTLTIPDDAPAPFNTPTQREASEKLYDKMTDFVAQVINVGLNYEISPVMTLGFMVQAPVSERNAYRSTTLMGMFQLVF